MKTPPVPDVHNLPKKLKSRLRIGTCSWNYPEWQEIGIYSAKQKKHYDYLPEYAERFNTAEVDQWFWSLESPDIVRLPKSEDVEACAKLTPDLEKSLFISMFEHKISIEKLK